MIHLTQIIHNTFVDMLSAATGVLGFGWSIYSHQKNKKVFRLSYSSRTIKRFDKEDVAFLPGHHSKRISTNVFYADGGGKKEFEMLRIDEISIINNGTEYLHGTNMMTQDHLRAACHDGEIVASSIVGTTNKANDVRLEMFHSEVKLNFQFLAPRDAFSVRILHSGARDLKVRGGLIGAPASDAAHEPGIVGSGFVVVMIMFIVSVFAVLLLSIMMLLKFIDRLSADAMLQQVVIPAFLLTFVIILAVLLRSGSFRDRAVRTLRRFVGLQRQGQQ